MIMAGMLTGGAKTPSVPPRAMNAVMLASGTPMRSRMEETTAPKAKIPSAPGPVNAGGSMIRNMSSTASSLGLRWKRRVRSRTMASRPPDIFCT